MSGHGAVRTRGGSNGSSSRPGPYNRAGPSEGDVHMSEQDFEEGETDGHLDDTQEVLEGAKAFIKVSAQSNVKAVAGKIAHTCRAADPPAVLCIGASCINQAVKAIAISRGYLAEEGVDIAFQPAFRDKDRTRASVALYLAKQAAPSLAPDFTELPISGQSKPGVVAGALAARIREGKQVCLVAIGVDAVSNAVLTIGNARLYLEENNMDIRAMPEFVVIRKGEKDLNGLRFLICAETI